ncbi:unnamed protein product [Mesocestoides corti]|uniref:MFS domain-containing protein n=1 Tax=Mesocestoides corti TaxID=53468 RepID=A0A0R3UQG1_MESCO|nr:unnamed protein product [Mesocestoides corti]
MDQAISGYPIRRLLCLLFTVTFATGSGIAMQFLRIQYAYQVFVAEAKLPSNSSAPTPCSPSNSTRDPAIVTKFEWVQSQTAYVSTVYSLVAGILGLLSIIPIGYLADRKGRKLAIIVAWAGTYLEILISCLAVILKLPVYVLFIGSVPAGLAGNGLIAVQTQVYTGLADISIEHDPANNDSAETSKPLLDPARHRLILMGSFDAAIGLVYAAVTYAVGDLISSIGFVVPTALAITFATLCWIFVFFLPKTDAHQISRREDEEVLDDTVEVWEEEGEVEVASPTLISRVKSFCGFLHPVAFLGVSVIFITSFTIYSDADVATLYLMGHPFCWNANQVGMFM